MLGNHGSRFGGRNVPVVACAAVALAALAMGTSPAEGGARCISLEVDSPIRLPDGSLHPAGDLTLCDWKAVSPVSTLHRTYVGGQPVAMLQSRKTRSEGADRIAPVVMFEKLGDGSLELFGYVLPARGRSVTYLLNEDFAVVGQKKKEEAPAVASSESATLTDPAGAPTVVFVAARTH